MAQGRVQCLATTITLVDNKEQSLRRDRDKLQGLTEADIDSEAAQLSVGNRNSSQSMG